MARVGSQRHGGGINTQRGCLTSKFIYLRLGIDAALSLLSLTTSCRAVQLITAVTSCFTFTLTVFFFSSTSSYPQLSVIDCCRL